MANDIAYIHNYTTILDEAYKHAAVSTVLNSPRRMQRAGRNAKEVMIPKISVTGMGDYSRNQGYKTDAIAYEFESKAFGYDNPFSRLILRTMQIVRIPYALQSASAVFESRQDN